MVQILKNIKSKIYIWIQGLWIIPAVHASFFQPATSAANKPNDGENVCFQNTFLTSSFLLHNTSVPAEAI